MWFICTVTRTKKLAFYLTSSGYGGLEMNAVNLAVWMKERGWTVLFYTVKDSRVEQQVKNAGLKAQWVQKPNKYFDIKNAFLLANILKKDQVEKIIIFDNHDLSTANYCKKFFNARLKMLYLQQMQFKVKKTSPAHTFRFSGLNYWICPLESLKKQVLQTTKVPESKIAVIPLCLETDRFLKNSISRSIAHKELGLDENKMIIGVLGRIGPTKGQMGVLKAFSLLSKTHKDLDLLIMGEATINEKICLDYEKDCRQFVKENNLENRVHFRPFRPEVEYFYSAIDIFIMPSRKETYGMVTVEAMLSGVPIIGTNAGGTVDLLENGKLGQLYSFGDANELKEKIENIVLEKYNFSEISKEAKRIASEKYDHRIMCDQLESLLE